MGADSEVTHELERLGPYTLRRRIGAGGMAEGWLATREGAGGAEHRVFLKRIHQKHREDPDFIKYFLREAAIVCAMGASCPQIVTLIEADTEGRYLVFELIDGLDLKVLLELHPDGKLPVDLTVHIMTEVSKALAYAHARTSRGEPAGIIHRDLTPHNILISYEGAVKVADFGVAQVICEPTSGTSVVGKREYQSPEEAHSEPLDGRSDLFSLGVCGYQMLTGFPPFKGSPAQIQRAIAAGEYVPLQAAAPDAPTELAQIIDRLLSADADKRFQAARQLEFALYAAHRPDPSLYITLGHLVHRLKPHDTLVPAQPRDALTSPTANHDDAPTRREPPAGTPAPVEVSAERERSSSKTGAAKDTTGAPALLRARRRVLAYRAGGGLLAIGLATLLIMSRTRSTPHGGEAADDRPPSTALAEAAPIPPSSLPEPAAPKPLEPTQPTQSQGAVEHTLAEMPAPPTQPPTPAAGREHKSPPHGTLKVGTLPQAQVWIDGRLSGWSARPLRVAAGKHMVSIGSDGHEDSSTKREVTISPGQQCTVEF
jgi:serine/threonine protein kinase